MTTINCTSNCTYQENGKCTLQNVQSITSSALENCAYFTQNEKKGKDKLMHDSFTKNSFWNR